MEDNFVKLLIYFPFSIEHWLHFLISQNNLSFGMDGAIKWAEFLKYGNNTKVSITFPKYGRNTKINITKLCAY